MKKTCAAHGMAVLVACGLAASALGAPVNTTLPGGWTWNPIGGGTYDSGTIGTARGGANGQNVGPYTDTSFGVMNEPGRPWTTGGDLSAQQYVQAQAFGNFGTNSPPGPGGFRYYNFGYNNTNPGANFSRNANERRSVSVNHWNNTNPDAGGVATFGQIVRVPVSARLVVGQGFGADEMLVKAIGGNGGGTSKMRITSAIRSAFNTTAFGGLSSTNNSINLITETEFFDPGALGNYDMAYGFGVPLTAGQLSRSNNGTVTQNGTVIGALGQGLTTNSMGVGLSQTFNVLPSLLQDGSAFTVTFEAAALIEIFRIFGNADARASMGPGMEGNVQLIVEWQAFQAIPTPGSAALLALAGLVAARRGRA